MAVDVFGDRVHNHVCAMIQRILDIRAQEGIVHHNQHAKLMSDVGNSPDVHQAQCWVTGGLNPHQLSVLSLLEHSPEIRLNGAREAGGYAMGVRNLGEITVRATIQITNADDMTARGKTLEDYGSRGEARGKGQRIVGVLEGGYSVLEVGAVGICGPRILVFADGAADGGLCKSRGQRDL